MGSEMLYVQPFLRLVPSKAQKWEIHDLLAKRKIRVNQTSISILMAFYGGASVSEVINQFNSEYGVGETELLNIIERMIQLGLLHVNLDGFESINKMKERWRMKGWSTAFEHQLATYNYPYLDYQEDGVSSDRGLMRAYYSTEPDHSRFKVSASLNEITCAPINEVLGELSGTLELIESQNIVRAPIDFEQCSAIMTGVFAAIGWRGKGSEQVSPTARRTSPSGGARHPSEGYILNYSINDFKKGLYHFNVLRNKLVQISGLPTDFDLTQVFPALNISEISPQAIVLISTCPSRNMYRYREPRTLRTIYMDIGHLAATTELIANSLGLKVFGHHGFDATAISKMAGIESELEESFVYMIALEGWKDEG